MTKAALYARYSSDMQNPRSANEQLEKLREFAKIKEWEVVEKYKDEAISGRSIVGREGFIRMIKDSETGKFDLVLVEDLSRFSRDFFEGLLHLKVLKDHNVKIADTLKGVIDLNSFEGQILIGIDMASNQRESFKTGERVYRGQKEQALKGYSTGGFPPYGYKRKPDYSDELDKDGQQVRRGVRWEIDEKEAHIIKAIFEAYINGRSLSSIAKALNEKSILPPAGTSRKQSTSWDPSVIRAILMNETYQGHRVYGKTKKIKRPNGKRSYIHLPKEEWTITKNSHPPIISQELWDKAQARMQEIREKYNVTNRHFAKTRAAYSKYLLSGLMKCQCGASFVIVKGDKDGKHTGQAQYGCSYNHRRGEKVCTNSARINKLKAEKAITELLKEILNEESITSITQKVNEKLRESQDSQSGESQRIRKELHEVEKKLDNATELQLMGDFSETIRQKVKELEARKKALQEQLNNLTPDQFKEIKVSKAQVKPYLKNLLSTLNSDVPRARQILDKLISGITVEPLQQAESSRKRARVRVKIRPLEIVQEIQGDIQLVPRGGIEPPTP